MGVMKEMLDNSALYDGNAPFIEELYEQYLGNPALVGEEWREYFNRLQKMPGALAKDVPHSPVLQSFAERAKQPCFQYRQPMSMRWSVSRSRYCS